MKELKFEKFKFENSNIETSYCEALILVTLVIEMQKTLKSIKLMKLSYIYGHVWTSKCWHINFEIHFWKTSCLFFEKCNLFLREWIEKTVKLLTIMKSPVIQIWTRMTIHSLKIEKSFGKKHMFEECLSFILLNELKHV